MSCVQGDTGYIRCGMEGASCSAMALVVEALAQGELKLAERMVELAPLAPCIGSWPRWHHP
jgi:hypothetical protein